MPLRIRRTFCASGAAARVIAGRIRWRTPPDPKAGRRPPSSTANTRMSMRPSQERGRGQLDGRGPEVLEHHLHRRALLPDRGAEIAAGDRSQELEVLDVERPVQAELPAGLGDLLLGRTLVYEERGGVTGETDQEEHGSDHAPEHEHRVKRATKQE